MSRIYRESASCKPSIQQDAYIYVIAPVADHGLAAITSADEVLALSRQTLQGSKIVRFTGGPKGLTSLVTTDDGRAILCAGTDGTVASFDIRTQSKSLEFNVGRGVTALACRAHDIAVGTEFHQQQAVISVWDMRQNRLRWQNPENSDDITAVDFHPRKSNVLLSGGDDGLVSIFDTNIPEEDDSLLQAVNHGPIHKAGFYDDNNFYALSSDQNLALHPIYTEGLEEDSASILLGDLRPTIPCEYVINLFLNAGDVVVAAGSHSNSEVDLINLQPNGNLDLDHKIILKDGHGEEIVRSIFADNLSGTIFTAGEDGQIKAFAPSEIGPSNIVTPKSSKVKKASGTRYAPY